MTTSQSRATDDTVLERILQRKLHDARIARRCNLTKCRTVHGCRRKDTTAGIEKTRMIEQVEYFGPEVDFVSFRNWKRSRKCDIDVPRTGTTQGVAALVAVH